MTVLSVLRGFKPSKSATQTVHNLLATNSNPNQLVPISALRNFGLTTIRTGGGDRSFPITPSRYSWHQYKDLFHFYFMLGVIPLSILVFFVNIYVGPATLQEIPAGYKPKIYEYYRHPITRFLAQYFQDPQEAYERNLHYIMEDYAARDMRLLEWKAKRLMGERGDYPGIYQKRVTQNKLLRALKEEHEDTAFKYRGTHW